MVNFLDGLTERQLPRAGWGPALGTVGLLVLAGLTVTWTLSRTQAESMPAQDRIPGIGFGDPRREQQSLEDAAFIVKNPVYLRHTVAGRAVLQGAALAALEVRHRTGTWPQSAADYLKSSAMTVWATDEQGHPWTVHEGIPPREFTPFTVWSSRRLLPRSAHWPQENGCLLYSHAFAYSGSTPEVRVFDSKPNAGVMLLGGPGSAPYAIESCLTPLGDAAKMYRLLHGVPPPDLATLLDIGGIALVRERWAPLLPDISAFECWQYPELGGLFFLAVEYRGQWRYVTSSVVVRGQPRGAGPRNVLWRQSIEDAHPTWISEAELVALAP